MDPAWPKLNTAMEREHVGCVLGVDFESVIYLRKKMFELNRS